MAGQREAWEWWRRVTAYPVLWTGAYLFWLGLGTLLVFRYAAVRPTSLAVSLVVVIGVLPFALLSLSNWMLRAYDFDRQG